jgi:hypothetical protein
MLAYGNKGGAMRPIHPFFRCAEEDSQRMAYLIDSFNERKY